MLILKCDFHTHTNYVQPREGNYSPKELDLEPEHPQVLIWLAAKELKNEMEMYNRFFILSGPLDTEISKRLDKKIEECYRALKAYQDPEDL